MAYELSMWTAYPVAVVEDVMDAVPALVLVAPDLSDDINAGLRRMDSGPLRATLGRAVRHAAMTVASDGWGSEDDPLSMEDVLALTAENGVFRSALYDKGVVVAVPGERVGNCRIGLPVAIQAQELDFWPH